MNNKIAIYCLVGLIILIGIGAFVFFNKSSAPAPVAQTPSEETVLTIKPEEIGLSLAASADSKKVILQVSNTAGISGLDYELSYTSKGDIPRGVIGHIDVKQAGKKVIQEITLGTCSDVCHYDQDVSNIKLILKVTKTDGTTSQAQQILKLEQ